MNGIDGMDDILINYFYQGLQYHSIRDILREHHEVEISVRQIKRIFRRLGLWRKTNFTDIEYVVDYIKEELSNSGVMHGYRWMHRKCQKNGLVVSRGTVRHILGVLDPEGVDFRSRGRLRRRRYTGKGPNYIWHADGYDKLKPYGIAIHGCVDGFSRKLIWLNAAHSNNDPYIIAGYFSKAIEDLGGCPSRLRTDYVTENVNMEAMQMALRDDAIVCYLYGPSVLNQRIESFWAILRRECTQFWINVFSELKDDGHYNGTWYEKDLIRLCFLQLIQVSYTPETFSTACIYREGQKKSRLFILKLHELSHCTNRNK